MHPHEDALAHLEPATVVHQRSDRPRDGRPLLRPLVAAERDPRGVPAQERRHDQRDEAEDQVGLAQVAALESGRPLHLADQEGGRDAHEHEHAEDVDEKEEPALVAEPRDRPVTVDRTEEGQHDRREEDHEPPEDQRVHHARHEPLHELALAEDDRRLGADAAGDVAAAVDGLPHPHETEEQLRATHEQAARDRQEDAERERGEDRRHAAGAITRAPAGSQR